MTESVQFEAVEFQADIERRVLSGVVLPFNAVSRPSTDPITGRRATYTFDEGTVSLPEPSSVVLNYAHDNVSLSAVLGTATHLETRPDGVHATFSVIDTDEGTQVLTLAKAGRLKSFSAEVTGEFTPRADGVQRARTAQLTGVAVVAAGKLPAFAGADITHVAASAAEAESESMSNETPEVVETAAVSLSADDVRGIVADEFKRALASDEVRVPVQAPQFQVREEPIYRFNAAVPGRHDLSADLVAGCLNGDSEAKARVVQFMSEALVAGPQFVSTSDTGAVNQTRYNPGMFLDEGPAQPTPLYSALYKGSLSDVTPFSFSKLGSYSGPSSAAPRLVNDHTEGVEPGLNNFAVVTGDTITPRPVSGKIHITREVADQGGNPQVSSLIWSKFQRDFANILELRAAAAVQSAVAEYSALVSISNGASGADLGATLEGGLSGLAFRADGSRFTRFFGEQDLFQALQAARDAEGRPLYPILNPTNANGATGNKFGVINVGGFTMEPTWSLGTSNVSYLIDPAQSVMVWNSGLTKLDRLQEDVEGYNIGAWAYVATHVYDASGVLKVSYTK